MQLKSSNIFGNKDESTQQKLSNAIILSLIGGAEYRGLAGISDDTILAIPEQAYEHHSNGKVESSHNEVSDFGMNVLDINRVLINVVDFKEARKVFDKKEVYAITDAEEEMEDYLEIEKVLNVIVINTKSNLAENNINLALLMSRAYWSFSSGSSRTLLTDENNIPKAIHTVLNKAEDNAVENVYIYRNNSLVALGVGEFEDRVVLNSIRIVDL